MQARGRRRPETRALAGLCVVVGLGGCSGGAPAETETASATAATEATDTSGSTTAGSTTGAGAGWVQSLQAGTEHGAFLSVWGPSASEVYAVGGQLGDDSHGTVMRYDGAAWTEVALPDGTPSLNWVYGVDGELWVVGYEGAALRREGDGWVTTPTPTTSMLWGVWGSAKDELWAVGGDAVDDAPVLLRWDGAAWAEVALPAIDPDCHGLFKVWGSAADDVTIVGDRGVTLRYDGASWSASDSGSIADLISVWGPGDATRVAVGGRANGRVARWDGAAWTGETLAIPGLNGVWVDDAGVATIVGWQGYVATVQPGAFEPVQEDSDTPLLLHAVYGFAGGPRFAVGGSLQSAPPFVGVIVMDPGE